MNNTLGKYGTIYLNYLKEYKKDMYRLLKKSNKLYEHCKQRGVELKELSLTLERQLKQSNTKPKTNDFIKVVKYNNQIQSMVDELVKDEIIF